MSRGKKIKKKCKNCDKIFYPRVADVNRGWGKFCSKSCKAKRADQYSPFKIDGEVGGTVIEQYEDGTELFYATHFSNED